MTLYRQAVNFLLIKHAINDIIAKPNMDIMNFKQPIGQIQLSTGSFNESPAILLNFRRMQSQCNIY